MTTKNNSEIGQTQQDRSYTGAPLVWDLLGHSAKVSIVMRMLAREGKTARAHTLHTLLYNKWENIPKKWQDKLFLTNWSQ